MVTPRFSACFTLLRVHLLIPCSPASNPSRRSTTHVAEITFPLKSRGNPSRINLSGICLHGSGGCTNTPQNPCLRLRTLNNSVENSASPEYPGNTIGPLLTYPIRPYQEDRQRIWNPPTISSSSIVRTTRNGFQPSASLARAQIVDC